MGDFLPVIFLIIALFIGLIIFLHAKYYIDPNSTEVDRHGFPIQLGRKRFARLLMIFTGAIIPFYTFGLCYSYHQTYIEYRDKKYLVVEGMVQNLRDHTEPKQITHELFSIDTVQFDISLDHGGQEILENPQDSLVRIYYLPGGEYKRIICKIDQVSR